MKIIEKWWDKGNKVFSIYTFKKSWCRPQFFCQTNGAKRKNGDRCFDWKIVIGYIVINYTNFNLQKEGEQK